MTRVTYHSGMALIDSLVMTYRIYHLKNPLNNEIFYVGKTTKELKERLTGHLGSTTSNGSNKEKNEYIKSILAAGQRPLIEEIDCIFGTCYIHKVEASAKEFYWMVKYQAEGIKLTNHLGVKTDPMCAEWERYLADIKETKGLYNNYYCGKDQFGNSVYDEEKMTDDGFIFEQPKSIEEDEDPYKPPERVITYVPIYDDENPDYIRGSLEEI